MSLMRFTTSVSLAILVLPALYAAPRCPGNVASLTLRLVQGSLIIVPVEINHSGPYDFLVDTGAQITTVDSSLAVDLGLKAHGTTGIGGVATYRPLRIRQRRPTPGWNAYAFPTRSSSSRI